MRRFLIRIGVVAATLLAGLAVATPAHAVSTWFSNEYTGASVNVNGTYQALVGDFAGDDHDDIIWYAPGPTTDFLWTSNGNGTFAKAPLAKQVNGTYIPLVGDFGKDNHDDIFWYKPGSDADYLWMFQSGQIYEVTHYIAGVYTPVVLHDSHYGSGDDDILWYAPGPATDYLWLSNGDATFDTLASPDQISGTYTPIVGDFAGSAADDIVWYAPGSAADSIWNFNTAQGGHATQAITVPGSPKPVVGDYDGNGFADILWYNPGTTADSLWRRTTDGGPFTATPQTINGTFTPVVQLFTPDHTDERSDILWFASGAAGDSLWEGKADGSFIKTSHAISDTGTPLGLIYDWGYTYTWNPSGPDRVWYDNVSGPDHDEDALNTEIPAGYTPLVGNFNDDGSVPAIFWYKAGSATEYLFY